MHSEFSATTSLSNPKPNHAELCEHPQSEVSVIDYRQIETAKSEQRVHNKYGTNVLTTNPRNGHHGAQLGENQLFPPPK